MLHFLSNDDFETVGELTDAAIEALAALMLAPGEVSGQSDEGDG